MADQFWSKGLEGILDGTIALSTDTISPIGVSGYTFNAAHSVLSDVTGAGGSLIAPTTIGAATSLASKTFVNALWDAADNTSALGSPTTGTVTALIMFKNTGTASTSRLIFIATSWTGLPRTANSTPIGLSYPIGIAQFS